VAIMSMMAGEQEWIYLRHDDIDGTTRVLDEPGVLALHEARGWYRVDPPDPAAPFVPKGGHLKVDEDADWINMVHPGFGGHQRIPNNPEALRGAEELGWRQANKADQDNSPEPPEPATAPADVEPEPEPDDVDDQADDNEDASPGPAKHRTAKASAPPATDPKE
jgi:hypothetical protein